MGSVGEISVASSCEMLTFFVVNQIIFHKITEKKLSHRGFFFTLALLADSAADWSLSGRRTVNVADPTHGWSTLGHNHSNFGWLTGIT